MKTLSQWHDYQKNIAPKAIDLTLERVKAVFCKLVFFHAIPLVITVAGTNGKGSTIAYLENILTLAGYKTASYTSPHISQYTERFKINKQNISENILCQAYTIIEAIRDNILLTPFEYDTLAAFWIFSQYKLDIWLLEVGLGGRLDAVNIIDANIAIITSIALDHQQYLGNTREEIAYEKAGILRDNQISICCDANPPAILQKLAAKAKYYQINKDFYYQKQDNHWMWYNQEKSYTLPYPSLVGEHQLVNISGVIQALQSLSIPAEHISQGIKNTYLPARIEKKIIYNIPFYLDVAHNPQAAFCLAQTLEKKLDKNYKTYALFSVLKDKDIPAIIQAMTPIINDWIIVELPHISRAETGENIAKYLQQINISPILMTTNITQVLSRLYKEKNIQVIVFGTFYIIEQFMRKY